jgi:hypothetical protein
LKTYNTAAAAIGKKSLAWKDVVSMVTLADFDLLRDVKNSVAEKPWADGQVREAMNIHFRMKRAREEIHRLNIEIRRQITYMRDEHVLYRLTAAHIKQDQPNLAAYIIREGDHRDALFTHITFYLIKTRRLPLFTGTLAPGTRAGAAQSHHLEPIADPPVWWLALTGQSLLDDDVESQTSDEEDQGQTLLDLVENISIVE